MNPVFVLGGSMAAAWKQLVYQNIHHLQIEAIHWSQEASDFCEAAHQLTGFLRNIGAVSCTQCERSSINNSRRQTCTSRPWPWSATFTHRKTAIKVDAKLAAQLQSRSPKSQLHVRIEQETRSNSWLDGTCWVGKPRFTTSAKHRSVVRKYM